jgi:recombination protein RecA
MPYYTTDDSPILEDPSFQDFMTGCLLGDGCLYTPKGYTHSSIYQEHGPEAEYLRWKANHLARWLGAKIYEYDNFSKVQQKMRHDWFLITRSSQALHQLSSEWYGRSRKHIPLKYLDSLTPLGLAVWFMDDGYWYSEPVFCTDNFAPSEVDALCDLLGSRWGIDALPMRQGLNLRTRIRLSSSRKFIEIIGPYVVPTMLYKTISTKGWVPYMGPEHKAKIALSVKNAWLDPVKRAAMVKGIRDFRAAQRLARLEAVQA